ncbi:hypothetical protein E4U43_007289 [Claviceps pusilla]|uniref:Uncharacterized protein n=1 Tax=Claviceps pusilla TaxID=123648 RepID=A0A9P7NCQ8_9HYPO|nr:hypothetical protein E4U43_007289 [Claviceps pusilla]
MTPTDASSVQTETSAPRPSAPAQDEAVAEPAGGIKSRRQWGGDLAALAKATRSLIAGPISRT